MSRSILRTPFLAGCVAFLLIGAAGAQQAQPQSEDLNQRIEHREQRVQEGATPEQGAGDANIGVAEILTATTENAAHTAEAWGHRLGLGKDTSFAVSLALNFLGIALFFWLLLKTRLPQAFRERTAAIQKGIKEAQAASAEASRRLSDIEARLSKLDAEVEDIRKSAEREAAAEEERIRATAEQDKQKIIAGAEAEIEAMARNARRELKGYAASLAVDLAARRIQVDESTDRELVREFVDQFGKDGR